jgi:uncharacterized protein
VTRKKGIRSKRLLLLLLLLLFISAGLWVASQFFPREKPTKQVVHLPVPPIERPKEREKPLPAPKLALIIDDGGYNKKKLKGLIELGKPLTFAILPDTPFARQLALLAHQDGAEVMIHLPMEPRDKELYHLEKNTVLAGTDSARIHEILQAALKKVPYARGLNNHMGSKATEDPKVMEVLMEDLKKEGLYFIDSQTSAHSRGLEMAHITGVASGRNERFVDKEKNLPAIKEAIRFAMRKAKQAGKAVAIGHPDPLTTRAIREMIPEIEKEGIQMVYASEVVG